MKKIFNLILILIISITFSSQVFSAECNYNCKINQNRVIIEDITYKSRNIDIPATITVPENQNMFPLVVIAHGFGTSRMNDKGLIELSEALAKNGIASIRMDFSGCGDSKESFRNFTLKTSKLDILNAISYMKSKYNITNVGIAGYSLSGRVIVEMLAEGQKFDSVVLIAPSIDNDSFSNSDEGYRFADLVNYADKNGVVPFVTNRGKVLEISNNCLNEIMLYNNPQVLLEKAKQNSQETPIMVVWAKDDTLILPEMNLMTYTILKAKSLEASGDGHHFGFLAEQTDKKNTKLRKRVVKKTLKFLKSTLR